MANNLYEDGVKKLKQLIEEKKPDTVIFLGSSAQLLKNDLQAINCVPNSRVFPSRRDTVGYVSDIESVVSNGNTAIVAEDYALTGQKVWRLRKELPANIEVVVVVGHPTLSKIGINSLVSGIDLVHELDDTRRTRTGRI